MKDKVLQLSENIRVYVIDELTYKDKKYVFAFEVTNNDDLLEDKPHVLEVDVINEDLVVNEIDDIEIASVVNNLFVARLASGE